MESKISLQNIAIRGTLFLEENGELIEQILGDVKKTELPPELDSQVVNIDQENPKNSALIFSDGLPDGPVIAPGSIEIFSLSVDDDGDISVSVDFSAENLEVLEGLFNAIVSHTSIHITDFNPKYKIDYAFSELVFEVNGPEDFEYTGVKFSDGKYDHIIQSSSSEGWLDDESVTSEPNEEEEADSIEDGNTAVTIMNQEHFDIEDDGDTIQHRVEDIQKTLTRIVP
ncbi:hypothetical protein [Halobacterium zhouii]|uniref:hypothetical protein n=1 Tax=Halobacterium zhouii TaxID=2902624 RepID=UPI001E326A55|nr:hypothetical protein [Halobacterium zhouii]